MILTVIHIPGEVHHVEVMSKKKGHSQLVREHPKCFTSVLDAILLMNGYMAICIKNEGLS